MSTLEPLEVIDEDGAEAYLAFYCEGSRFAVTVSTQGITGLTRDEARILRDRLDEVLGGKRGPVPPLDGWQVGPLMALPEPETPSLVDVLTDGLAFERARSTALLTMLEQAQGRLTKETTR